MKTKGGHTNAEAPGDQIREGLPCRDPKALNRRRRFPFLVFTLLLATLPMHPATPPAQAAGTGSDLPAVLPPAPRIVAIGDLHGDLDSTRRALRLAGAVDEQDQWIGGDLVLVQTGDILDRGSDEQAILDLFQRLKKEAREAGGAVYTLNGNHEVMNAELDFRYLTDEALMDFADAPGVAEALQRAQAQGDSAILALPQEEWARAAAFRPGGPYARILADQPVALQIGPVLFNHAGLRPRYARVGLDEINRQGREWLLGRAEMPEWADARKGPVWSRDFSDEVDIDDCDLVQKTLEILGAKHLVVGHTVHDSITSYCDGRIWCIDTGMSSAYGGGIHVLEIRGDEFRVLSE